MATELGSESTAEKGPHAYLSSKAHRKPSEGQTGPRRSGRPLTGSSPQSFLPQCAPPRPCPSPSGILSEPAWLRRPTLQPSLRLQPLRAAPGQQARSSLPGRPARGTAVPC